MGWRIHFDKKDYLRLRRLEAPDDLRERLARGVRRIRGKAADGKMYGQFDLEGNGGRCPFWDPDGLCAIQRACGHDALPHVCTDYPQHIVYSPAAKEYALSPSCEGALEQLWKLPQGIEFIEEPLPKTEHRVVRIIRGEPQMRYATIRGIMLGILQDRALSLTERMLYLGIAIQRLQEEDWTDFDLDSWGYHTVSLIENSRIKGSLEKIMGNRVLFLVQNLRVLGVIWKGKKEDWIREVFEALGIDQKIVVKRDNSGEADLKAHFQTGFSLPSYEEALAEFEKAFSEQKYFFENLMVAAALYLDFPSLVSKEGLWKSYVSLCNLYSFYRFVMVLGCKGRATRERLFHMIVIASRVTLHNRERFHRFQEDLFQHDSSTLGHMAILLRG